MTNVNKNEKTTLCNIVHRSQMAFFKVFFLHVNLILARLKLVFHNNTKLPGQNKQNSYFNVRCNILYEIELQQDQ